ncbi:hypothetical protein B0T26DRAFT_748693 [Lasiosphaeria miniovina]|uniref:Uncharacterized protein n=1 Tax=Lasiosphaeria miniovina TaxID=1954250 RepID=A0AA40EAM2_9PEZI|nr:uncharacterized protein B0T26DRAFT_748693 [Lasiosphaeria miniovina]KAK0728478.1 hypothetical protein B0T26DRAFT_748693 [Lasiosphaeria miniovina]
MSILAHALGASVHQGTLAAREEMQDASRVRLSPSPISPPPLSHFRYGTLKSGVQSSIFQASETKGETRTHRKAYSVLNLGGERLR